MCFYPKFVNISNVGSLITRVQWYKTAQQTARENFSEELVSFLLFFFFVGDFFGKGFSQCSPG